MEGGFSEPYNRLCTKEGRCFEVSLEYGPLASLCCISGTTQDTYSLICSNYHTRPSQSPAVVALTGYSYGLLYFSNQMCLPEFLIMLTRVLHICGPRGLIALMQSINVFYLLISLVLDEVRCPTVENKQTGLKRNTSEVPNFNWEEIPGENGIRVFPHKTWLQDSCIEAFKGFSPFLSDRVDEALRNINYTRCKSRTVMKKPDEYELLSDSKCKRGSGDKVEFYCHFRYTFDDRATRAKSQREFSIIRTRSRPEGPVTDPEELKKDCFVMLSSFVAIQNEISRLMGDKQVVPVPKDEGVGPLFDEEAKANILGAIIGGVIGCIVLVILIVFCCLRGGFAWLKSLFSKNASS